MRTRKMDTFITLVMIAVVCLAILVALIRG
jgi:hypothetical protein